MRRLLSLVCLVAGLVCFVVFVYPRHEKTARDGTSTDRWEVGVPGSPWLTSAHEEEDLRPAAPAGPGSFTKRYTERRRVELISASWPFLLGGLALFAAHRRLRAAPKTTTPNPGGAGAAAPPPE
jgi:hypothetical protein